MTVTSRSAECPCGSGKRYKHCCDAKNSAASTPSEASTSLRVRTLSERQAGCVAQASELHTQVLANDPRGVDCFYMLGVLNFQSGRHFEVLDQL